MAIAFGPVDKARLRAFLDLALAPGQEKFVAPNAVTFAQSIYEPGSEIHGIFHNSQPAGLLALVDCAHPEADLDEGDDPDSLYVWRLMIAAQHQRHGLGTAALEFAAARARKLGRAQLFLSAVDAPGSPIPFYEKSGFTATGRIIDDEVEFRLLLT